MQRILKRQIKHLRYYAVTISLAPYSGNVLFKYIKDKVYIRDTLKHVTKHYIFYPEFDDNGRYHLHGIMRIDDMVKWYKRAKRQIEVMGFIKIEKLMTFKDHLQYLNYCKKNWHENSELFIAPIKSKNKPKKRKPKRTFRNRRIVHCGVASVGTEATQPLNHVGRVRPAPDGTHNVPRRVSPPIQLK